MPNGKPNILVLWGDDIGWYNISHNNRGAMGYRTPNIDRIAQEGIEFTDYYGQQSCTAGRAAFITGQNPLRTGLTKVGIPGSDLGLQPEDPTIAELLKPLGYATGQFGKNHLGDRDEFLPSNHGFDEFYGNLYHLNAEEEPENADYPHGLPEELLPRPRGVIHSYADGRIEDTGPLTQETHGDHRRRGYRPHCQLHRAGRGGRQALLRLVELHAHALPHPHPGGGDGPQRPGLLQRCHGAARPGRGPPAGHAGRTGHRRGHHRALLDGQRPALQHVAGCGDHALAQREEYQLGRRVTACPPSRAGRASSKPAKRSTISPSHQDWLPTLLAAAGDPDIKQKLLDGHDAGDKHFNVHIDGENLLPWLTGETDESPRKFFAYVNDDGALVALRAGDWKVVFQEQRAKTMQLWAEPFVELRLPKIFNLRRDPFERADENSNTYWDWHMDHVYMLYPGQNIVAQQIQSFIEFPPRQEPASFNLDNVLRKMQEASGGGLH